MKRKALSGAELMDSKGKYRGKQAVQESPASNEHQASHEQRLPVSVTNMFTSLPGATDKLWRKALNALTSSLTLYRTPGGCQWRLACTVKQYAAALPSCTTSGISSLM